MDQVCKVFVGFDSKQPSAFDVLEWSIKLHAKRPVEVIPIKLSTMQEKYGFKRELDPLQSTEFTYTRFLVPLLMNYQGLALFLDSDMLALGDLTELFDLPMDGLALRCVKHDHQPTEQTKMGGLIQTSYPRKNWSSLWLADCSKLKCWTKEAVETQSGAWLHRFEPIPDDQIGDIDGEVWNVLDKHAEKTKLIHYTAGGPWLPGCEQHEYGDIWRLYRKGMIRDRANGLGFRLNEEDYFYEYRPENFTWMNERCVELPIICDFLDQYLSPGKRVLEIGNVLSQYEYYTAFENKPLIVDKDETGPGILNQDILEFADSNVGSLDGFDLILSISTFEHVGLDDLTKDLSRSIDAIKKCAYLLNPGGKMIFTVPVGYNKVLDAWLLSGWFGNNQYLIRIDGKLNRWVETDIHQIFNAKYGVPYHAANALIVGHYTKPQTPGA